MALRPQDIPERYEFKKLYGTREWINVGRSAIVDPEGNFLAGPVERKEEILYAEIDRRQVKGSRWILDTAGHYARPDIFQLTVNREERPMIRAGEAPAPAARPPDQSSAA
jgi:nitrilase